MDRNVKGREMSHTQPGALSGETAFTEEAMVEDLQDQKAGAPVLECLWAGALWKMRSWEGARLGLRLEVVGEEERVAGRVVGGLGIERNFCMCGRWSVRGWLDKARVGTV